MKGMVKQSLKKIPKAPCPNCSKPATTGRTKRSKK